jgi:hypothetical protein
VPVADTVRGMALMAQHADAFKLWRSFGGAFADQFREPEEAAQAIARMAKRGGFSAGSIISPGRLLDALKKAGSYSESGSRIGEFAATYKPGDFESALQAALNAREVSTDFGMRGGAEAIQAWTAIVPFMNPAMQGIYKTARVLSGADGRQVQMKAAVVGSAMALVSIALALKNSDEDWYNRLEEWEKTVYWHFKLGGEIWRVPKPFEYGMLFASVPEAIALRVSEREGGEDFKKRMLQAISIVFQLGCHPVALRRNAIGRASKKRSNYKCLGLELGACAGMRNSVTRAPVWHGPLDCCAYTVAALNNPDRSVDWALVASIIAAVFAAGAFALIAYLTL